MIQYRYMKCKECEFIKYCEVCGKPIYGGQKFPPYPVYPNYPTFPFEPNKIWCESDDKNKHLCGDGLNDEGFLSMLTKRINGSELR